MYTNKNSNNICRYCIEMWNNLTGSVRPYSVQYTKKSNFLIIKLDFYSFLCGNMHSNIVNYILKYIYLIVFVHIKSISRLKSQTRKDLGNIVVALKFTPPPPKKREG